MSHWGTALLSKEYCLDVSLALRTEILTFARGGVGVMKGDMNQINRSLRHLTLYFKLPTQARSLMRCANSRPVIYQKSKCWCCVGARSNSWFAVCHNPSSLDLGQRVPVSPLHSLGGGEAYSCGATLINMMKLTSGSLTGPSTSKAAGTRSLSLRQVSLEDRNPVSHLNIQTGQKPRAE